MKGKKILHYRILEKLGEGGMGIVYLAEDTRLERKVAIKFLPRQIAVNAGERRRFEIEAKAAAALNHPNIAIIHAIEEAGADIFIVMEYIEGQELRDVIRGCGETLLPLAQIIDIATQIGEGLQAAHEEGIVHRDIKSANIMLNGKGRVKIMDFGLAKVRGGMQLTKEHSTLGTAAYMSPEQARGIAVDHRTDIWSFGVVFYEMLTGELPFKSEYEQALIYLILNEEPQPLRNLRPEIPTEIEQIIRKALEKEAQRRYASMKELLDDLENFRRGIRAVPAQTLTSEAVAVKNAVAVIDFTNITGHAAIDWLCGGIAETVTVDLKKISALNVVSRERVAKALTPFTGQDINEEHTLAIGKTLGVRWLVWGGFQKLGQALRITAHFTEVPTGEWIGSTRADGMMEDIFKLQDQIVAALMDTLNLVLTPSEIKKIETPEAQDVEAYEYYARGRQLYYRFGKSSFEQARELYEKAIAVDPHYALAYSGLGSIYIFRFIGNADVRDLETGLNYLQKAIVHDPDLAEPYIRLTYAYTRNEQLDEAVDAGEKALTLEPDNFHAYYFLGVACFFKVLRGHQLSLVADALKYFNKCSDLQPRFEPVHLVLFWLYMLNGHYSEAKKHADKAVEIEETEKFEGEKFVGAWNLMGSWHFHNQRLDAALECLQRSLMLLENSDHFYAGIHRVICYCIWAKIHYQQCHYDDALKLLKKGLETISTNPGMLGAGYLLVRIKIWQARCFNKLGMQREAKQGIEAALSLFETREGYDFNLGWEENDAQSYYDFAGYFAQKNQPQEAFEYLRKALAHGWADLLFLESDEAFARFRERTDYQSIVQNLKTRAPLL